MEAVRTNTTKTTKGQITMMSLIQIAISRLSENSTWRGLILVATALGVKMEPELQNQIVTAGLSLVGLINIVRKGK